MGSKNLLGLINRIREIVFGHISEFEPNKKTLPECLIDLQYEYKLETAKRALELTRIMELDCKLLERELKQLIAIKKYVK